MCNVTIRENIHDQERQFAILVEDIDIISVEDIEDVCVNDTFSKDEIDYLLSL